MKQVLAIIERAGDGRYSIYLDDDTLEYCISGQGDTAEEAKADLEAVYKDMRSIYKRDGKQFTEVEFVYQFDFQSFLTYYSKVLTLVGLSRITGINKGQLSHYINGVSKPNPRTREKIRYSVGNFASDLALNTRFV